MTPPLGRRQLLAAAGATSAALALTGGGGTAHAATGAAPTLPPARPFPLTAVTLLEGPFRDNQRRNSAYLRFVDTDRLLHTFRTNVGLPSSALPCGGWEGPDVELRGHSTGHLLSGLALAYANTGDASLRDKGRTLVAELAKCQAASPAAGFGTGYLSAFPESFFDRLEAGTGVWAPYYTIHKIMAGLVEQYRMTGNDQALDVVLQQARWVDARTAKLSYEQMQRVLETEFGGMNDVLADLHALTGDRVWLDVAERFTHARVFDPLARNEDRLAGLHANTQIPKMVGSLRLWEEGLPERYRTIAANFWRIVTGHHSYVIGGNSNGEAFHEPDVVAGQLSDNTCENCNSYNMLKLTRLLHLHTPERVELLDFYERALFNQMLGEQDPDSEHGFNIYYTGLAPGSFKRQPSFMGTDPNAYSTDYDNFSCDHGTGMETHAKFADTIYTHDEHALLVNLFIPSQVVWHERGITWRQTTGFPDRSGTTLRVTMRPGHASTARPRPGLGRRRPRDPQRPYAARPSEARELADSGAGVAYRRPGRGLPADAYRRGTDPRRPRRTGGTARPGGAGGGVRRPSRSLAVTPGRRLRTAGVVGPPALHRPRRRRGRDPAADRPRPPPALLGVLADRRTAAPPRSSPPGTASTRPRARRRPTRRATAVRRNWSAVPRG